VAFVRLLYDEAKLRNEFGSRSRSARSAVVRSNARRGTRQLIANIPCLWSRRQLATEFHHVDGERFGPLPKIASVNHRADVSARPTPHRQSAIFQSKISSRNLEIAESPTTFNRFNRKICDFLRRLGPAKAGHYVRIACSG
jgi:hypothetical protein